MKNHNKSNKSIYIILVFIVIIGILYFINFKSLNTENNISNNINQISYEITNLPDYNGNIYVTINNNTPNFSQEDLKIKDDYYSNLENNRVRNGNDKDQLE